MRDPSTSRSRGFAFLTFDDPKAVNSVMVKEHFLDGKIVSCDIQPDEITTVLMRMIFFFRLIQKEQYLVKKISRQQSVSLAVSLKVQHLNHLKPSFNNMGMY